MFNLRNKGAQIMKDNKMKVVHDDDLKSLLQSLGVYNNVVNGKYTCIFCNRKITLENIDSIVPIDHAVQFTCDSEKCHLKLIGWGK